MGEAVRVSWPAYYLFTLIQYHYCPEMMGRPANNSKSVLEEIVYVFIIKRNVVQIKKCRQNLGDAYYIGQTAGNVKANPYLNIESDRLNTDTDMNLFSCWDAIEYCYSTNLEVISFPRTIHARRMEHRFSVHLQKKQYQNIADELGTCTSWFSRISRQVNVVDR